MVADVEDVSDGSFNLGLSIQGTSTMIVLDGWGKHLSGLNLVDRRTGNNNPTTYQGQVLKPGRTNRVEVEVDGRRVLVTVNQQKVIDRSGQPQRLSLDRRFWPDPGPRIMIGSWETNFFVRRLELFTD